MTCCIRFLLFFITFLILPFSTYSYEKADSYVVRAFSDHYKVLTPAKESNRVSVIVENKMLVDLVGRLETEKGRVLSFIRVDAGKYKSVSIKNHKVSNKILFFPLSPAFQKIELKLGVKSYEIPPKR